MRVLGQKITELPKSGEDIELAVIAGSTAGLGGLLYLIGKEAHGLERGAAWGSGAFFVLAGIGAAVKLCQASKK